MSIYRRPRLLLGFGVALALGLLGLFFGSLMWAQALSLAAAQANALGASTKTVTPVSAYAGDTVTFTIALHNTGGITLTANVTDVLPSVLALDCGSILVHPEGQAAWVCDAPQNTLTYTATNLQAQSSVTLSFQAVISTVVTPGISITNTAQINDGSQVLLRTASLTVADPMHYVYLPLIMRRWPPIPYPPAISITTSDLGGNYMLSWTYGNYPAVPPPNSYELQESPNAAFTTLTSYTVSGTTYVYNFTNKPNGLYYYRVRGHNGYGAGEWSQTVTASVSRVYYDDFSNPASGWHTGQDQRYNFWDPNHLGWETVSYIGYLNNHYNFYIPLTRHGGQGLVDSWWVWPAVAAPLPAAMQPIPENYCIEARARFISHLSEPGFIWWAHWGIVFGGNADFNDIYTFQINDNRNRALIQYPSYAYPGNDNIRYRTVYNDHWTNIENRMIDWYPDGMQFYNINSNPEYNTIKVVVQGKNVNFYVNDVWMLHYYFGGGVPREKIGLIAGNWEVTPQELQVDYFRYEPNCPASLP